MKSSQNIMQLPAVVIERGNERFIHRYISNNESIVERSQAMGSGWGFPEVRRIEHSDSDTPRDILHFAFGYWTE